MTQAANPNGSGGLATEQETAKRRVILLNWAVTIALFALLGIGVQQLESQLATWRWRALEGADLGAQTPTQTAGPTGKAVTLPTSDTSGQTPLVVQVGTDSSPQFAGYDTAGRPVSTGQGVQVLPRGGEPDRQ